jgi:hypothetical protein
LVTEGPARQVEPLRLAGAQNKADKFLRSNLADGWILFPKMIIITKGYYWGEHRSDAGGALPCRG